MKRIAIALGIVATLMVGAAFLAGKHSTPAHGFYSMEAATPRPFPEAVAASFTPPYVQWESTVTDGGAIATPVLSIVSCDDISILVNNLLGTSTARTVTADWIGDDGTTIDYERVLNADAGQYTATTISRYASAATAGAYEAVIPQMPGSKMKFTLGAGPAATSATLRVNCR